ncbi:MAG TPA: hypothetical protein VGO80_08435 [Solirubrobacteraceae bacterium]|jgi:hypothetical protein|nr:hypothetical protein [Solirubrobacteraceae bacterium]
MRPDYAPIEELPASSSEQPIDFEYAEVVTLESFPPQLVLVVSGTKPFLNMEVTLRPVDFIQQPEYWTIEVIGRLPGGIGLPALAPYTAALRLEANIGTKGVEVVGATRRQEIDVEPLPAADAVEIVFSRDDRPVDGQLLELTIASDDGTEFNATLRTAHFDRIAGREVEKTEELASGLSGTIADDEVRLSRDDRPADGVLKELVVVQNAEGTFDATLRTASFGQIGGTPTDETVEIGSGLTRS